MKLVLLLVSLSISSFAIAKSQMNILYGDKLSSKMKSLSVENNIMGMSGAVIFPDGSIWSDAYGTYGTNGENELSPDMLYEIGSNTKTFIASTILILEEEGKLSIDDQISDYLPTIKYIDENTTIKQLLNHTSGIYNFTDHSSFPAEINGNPYKFWTVSEVFNKFLNKKDFDPGTDWSYSNTNYILLGLIIEEVSDGTPAHEIIREKLLDTLGLDDSFMAEFDDKLNYTKEKVGTWIAIDLEGNTQYLGIDFVSLMSSAWTAGAMVATPTNLAVWARELYGGKVLSKSSFQKMTETVSIGSPFKRYGLGMFETSSNGYKYFGHGGKTIQTSSMDYNTELDFSLVTVNIDQSKEVEHSLVANALIDILEEELSYLSISENENNHIKIYPNPSSDIAVIELNSSNNQSVEIFNSLGMKLRNFANSKADIRLSKEEFGAGVFFVRINSGEGTITEKLIFN
jgi:CubicO group peptidase (beta-lactamase class C family)